MNSVTSKPAKAGKDSGTLVTVTEVAEQVGREILKSQLEPGAWATALYESGGKRQEALALYARLRVSTLTKQHRIRLEKGKSFESRRLVHCMGDKATRELLAKTIQDMLHSSKRGRTLNFLKPKLSLLWLFILFVGSAGTIASSGRLVSDYLPETWIQSLTSVALLAGVGSVSAALLLRYFLPKRWIMIGWNTGLIAACNLVCLSSLFLGTKVIKRAIAADKAAFPMQQVSASPAKSTPAKPAGAANPYMVSTRTEKPPHEN